MTQFFTQEISTRGRPWVTTTTVDGVVRFDFPFVSFWIDVRNVGDDELQLAFSATGFAENFVSIPAGMGYFAELSIDGVYLKGTGQTVTVFAGLSEVASAGSGKSTQLSILSGSSGIG